jgi:uncharacterized membrane protein YfcA
MSKWPPIIWVMNFVASLLILVGYDGAEYNPQALIPGVLLIVGAVALSFYVAFGRLSDRPWPRGVFWLIPATAVFYAICALLALLSDEAYVVAALGAGMIPLTAATLITATARAKTAVAEGRLRDTASDDHTDPFPGIGIDDSTPLGDTPEHSDAERVAAPDRRSRRRR